jgi:hypothetical protein
MQNELFPPDQVAQMVLSGIEFIALFSRTSHSSSLLAFCLSGRVSPSG